MQQTTGMYEEKEAAAVVERLLTTTTRAESSGRDIPYLLPLALSTHPHTHTRTHTYPPMHAVQACRQSWKVALGEDCRHRHDSGHARRVRRLNFTPRRGDDRYTRGTFATNRGYSCDKPQDSKHNSPNMASIESWVYAFWLLCLLLPCLYFPTTLSLSLSPIPPLA